MTPASSVSGLPFEDPAPVGVRLEPEGLIFFKAVSLEIQPASIQEGLEWVGFGSDTGGQDFHLQPSVKQDGMLHLSLAHFSDYGMAQARKEEVRRLVIHIRHPLLKTMLWIRSQQLVDLVDDPTAQLDAITQALGQWFDNSILVRIQNAAVFDDRLDAAVGEFLSWKNWVEDLDLVLDFNGKLKDNLEDKLIKGLDALAVAFKNAFEKSSERCTSNKDPEEGFRMYRYGLVATYLQLWGRSGLDQNEAKNLLTACFKFDYLFRSKVVIQTDKGTKTSQVMARIPLKIDESGDLDYTGGILTEKGPLTFEINTLSNIPDFCELKSKPGEMSVSVIFKLNYSQNNPWSISVIHVMMLFTNRPEESITCTTQGQTISSLLLTWRPMFQAANKAFFEGGFMKLDLPIVKKGEIFAEQELFGPIEGVPDSDESSTYQIIHTP